GAPGRPAEPDRPGRSSFCRASPGLGLPDANELLQGGYWGMVRWGIAALVAAALSLTACGTDYHYVSNRDSGAYFKVPGHWEVYGTDELLQTEDRWLSDEEGDARTAAIWLRGVAARAA